MTGVLLDSIPAIDARLKERIEWATDSPGNFSAADQALVELGLIDAQGTATERGLELHTASHVVFSAPREQRCLEAALRAHPLIERFCTALKNHGPVPIEGAVALLKRLSECPEDASAKRWIELMRRGGIVAYSRRTGTVRVYWEPSAEGDHEKPASHVFSSSTPYANRRAVRELLARASEYLYWYEQHLGLKVLDLLHSHLSDSVVDVRLLSGPDNITDALASEVDRLQREWVGRVSIDWRVLAKRDAQMKHARLVFTKGAARHVPPLNLMLRGSEDEILPSCINVGSFDGSWLSAVPITTWLTNAAP